MGLFGGKLEEAPAQIDIIDIEGQDAANVQFPLTDSVFKARVSITALKNCKITEQQFELYFERDNMGDFPGTGIGDIENHNKDTDIYGMDYKWPYELAAGESKTDGCCMTGIDLVEACKSIGLESTAEIFADESLKLIFRFKVCAAGYDLDRERTVEIRLVKK